MRTQTWTHASGNQIYMTATSWGSPRPRSSPEHLALPVAGTQSSRDSQKTQPHSEKLQTTLREAQGE